MCTRKFTKKKISLIAVVLGRKKVACQWDLNKIQFNICLKLRTNQDYNPLGQFGMEVEQNSKILSYSKSLSSRFKFIGRLPSKHGSTEQSYFHY